MISIDDLIDELAENNPDFVNGYLEGRKWVADQFYGGDMDKLAPIPSKISALINHPI